MSELKGRDRFGERLYESLKRAVRDAFLALKSSHPDEQLYAFALLTRDDVVTILPTANSEEALQERYGRRVDEAEEPWLRWWFPSDWGYYTEGGELFGEVQSLLDEFDPYSEEVSDEEVEAHAQLVIETCVHVLSVLDEEGLFGRGADREQLVVNLLLEDMSDEQRIAWAKRLNPESVWRRFEAELEVVRAAWERKAQAGPPYGPY